MAQDRTTLDISSQPSKVAELTICDVTVSKFDARRALKRDNKHLKVGVKHIFKLQLRDLGADSRGTWVTLFDSISESPSRKVLDCAHYC